MIKSTLRKLSIGIIFFNFVYYECQGKITKDYDGGFFATVQAMYKFQEEKDELRKKSQ